MEICKDNLLQLRLDLQMQRHSLQCKNQWEEIYSRQELLLPLASLLKYRSYSNKSNR